MLLCLPSFKPPSRYFTAFLCGLLKNTTDVTWDTILLAQDGINNFMRSFEVITEARTSFRLHPGLDPNDYQITDSLRDIAKWRGRVYVGQGLKNEDHIGYVMISLVDDTIIPIARGDEHHQGSDLLYDFVKGSKKWNIPKVEGLNPHDYIPVWAFGQNYIYSPKDAPKLVIALRKYLSYGGIDGMLTGVNDYTGMMARLSTFVERDGNMEVEAGKLAPIGQSIYDGFVALAQEFRKLEPDADRLKTKTVFMMATKFFRDQIPLSMSYALGLDAEYVKTLPQQLRAFKKENDAIGLEELIFGFHGIKNKIHTHIKQNSTNVWRDRDIKGVWGDAQLAIDMLGRI